MHRMNLNVDAVSLVAVRAAVRAEMGRKQLLALTLRLRPDPRIRKTAEELDFEVAALLAFLEETGRLMCRFVSTSGPRGKIFGPDRNRLLQLK